MQKANDVQVGGTHYAGEVQHWDYAVSQFGTGYLKGQITKYVCRWRKKNGLQDLKKAAHFLQKLQEVSAKQVASETGVRGFALRLLRSIYRTVLGQPAITQHDLRLGYAEDLVCRCVERDELQRAAIAITGLIRAYEDRHAGSGAEPTRHYVDPDGQDSWERP